MIPGAQIQRPTAGKRHSGLCVNIDPINVKKLERRLRKQQKEKADVSENNNHKTAEVEMVQQDVVQSKQRKRKRKTTLDESSVNNALDKDILKEDLNENVKTEKTPSKRQLKREKAEKAEIEMRQSRKLNAKKTALNYLSKWKNCRNEWKFEKLKQIWLMDNLLDETCISDKLFPVVLEYFEGCKGMAREVLTRKGMEIVKKAEMETDEDSKTEIMKSIAYKRARQLLQTLPTDK
ncbi:uncharacterized protein C7orf50 homolog [Solenopsis invicta]|uniref:uncharacterized protein C7orf50 homolog n=1 Tax=Solenopsis invicta TaxID=13686 RepID=UPI0005959AD6|nr:uncharacterized protein C7orf50 homolog [Solenopsis invicta]